jgi:hypothetical protein
MILASGIRIPTEINGHFQNENWCIKVLDKYYNVYHFLYQLEYVNLS